MRTQTIIDITSSYEIDFSSPSAAMRLAWYWTARDLWSARKFDTDHRALFAAQLRAAWDHVRMVRENMRRAHRAKTDARIKSLRAQRDLLENKPFSQSIRAEQQRIDAEIADLLDRC